MFSSLFFNFTVQNCFAVYLFERSVTFVEAVNKIKESEGEATLWTVNVLIKQEQ